MTTSETHAMPIVKNCSRRQIYAANSLENAYPQLILDRTSTTDSYVRDISEVRTTIAYAKLYKLKHVFMGMKRKRLNTFHANEAN